MKTGNNRSLYIVLMILFMAAGLVLVWVFMSMKEGNSGVLVGIAVAVIAPLAGFFYQKGRRKKI